jgi:small subunit ribosomal protein S17
MSDIETTSTAGAGLTGASGAEATSTTAAFDDARNRRKVREGQVVSVSMNKTIVVAIVDRVRHGRYSKTIQQTQRLYVHDEVNDAKVGDKVRVMETRPLSKLKRWRLVEIVERAR